MERLRVFMAIDSSQSAKRIAPSSKLFDLKMNTPEVFEHFIKAATQSNGKNFNPMNLVEAIK